MTGFQVKQLKESDGTRVTEFPTRVRRQQRLARRVQPQARRPDRPSEALLQPAVGQAGAGAHLDPRPGAEGGRPPQPPPALPAAQPEPSRSTCTPYFGKKAWFVLKERMHVTKGQVVALTLPTWAPVLATDLRARERWRSSRHPDHCEDVTRSSAREKVGRLRDYRCVHTTARLLFTALVVPKTLENSASPHRTRAVRSACECGGLDLHGRLPDLRRRPARAVARLVLPPA